MKVIGDLNKNTRHTETERSNRTESGRRHGINGLRLRKLVECNKLANKMNDQNVYRYTEVLDHL